MSGAVAHGTCPICKRPDRDLFHDTMTVRAEFPGLPPVEKAAVEDDHPPICLDCARAALELWDKDGAWFEKGPRRAS